MGFYRNHAGLILSIFIIISIVFVALTYTFYTENVYKTSVIRSYVITVGLLEDFVEDLNKTVINQMGLIEDQGLRLNELKNKVSTLSDDLDLKNLKVLDLNNKLGLAKSEIESLKPVVKNYFVTALKDESKGVIVPLKVKISGGSGIISVNIKNVDLLTGTQDSVRTASQVASIYTGIGIRDKDITVSFENELNEIITVDGPSAGTAITATIIAALENRDLKSSIMVTGAINRNGEVGVVGGVLQKAEAAKEAGATKFLVPFNQRVFITGLEVEEVNSIEEVARILLS